jgi:hypothetical protein
LMGSPGSRYKARTPQHFDKIGRNRERQFRGHRASVGHAPANMGLAVEYPHLLDKMVCQLEEQFRRRGARLDCVRQLFVVPARDYVKKDVRAFL